MREKPRVSLVMVVLNILCAVIWAILTVKDITNGEDVWELVIHVLCTVLWIIAAVLNCVRYGNEKKNKN